MTSTVWWEPFADLVPEWFEPYLSLEQAAANIRTYETRFVPGLFQTPDYARAVVELAHSDPAEIERRVHLRQGRQRLLDNAQPPTIQAVTTAAAITTPPLTPGQRRAQIDRLIALSGRPNISILIAPPPGDSNRVADTSFTILEFNEHAQPGVVYVEQSDDAQYLRDPADLAHYTNRMDELTTSRAAGETLDLLRQIRGS